LQRDLFITVEQRTLGNLDPDEWAVLRRVIDLIQQNARGAELRPVLETIENALRVDAAKMIEAEGA
jgi:ABC-type ATPase involved in cell division